MTLPHFLCCYFLLSVGFVSKSLVTIAIWPPPLYTICGLRSEYSSMAFDILTFIFFYIFLSPEKVKIKIEVGDLWLSWPMSWLWFREWPICFSLSFCQKLFFLCLPDELKNMTLDSVLFYCPMQLFTINSVNLLNMPVYLSVWEVIY